MIIGDAMTRDPKCCSIDERANAAAQVFWEQDCGCVPLVDQEGHLAGVVTDRDLCMAAHFRDAKLSELRLGDICQRSVRCCSPEQSLQEAEALMQEAQVRRIPIVDASYRVVGLLSLNDIAVARDQQAPIQADEVANTLGAICSHRPLAAE